MLVAGPRNSAAQLFPRNSLRNSPAQFADAAARPVPQGRKVSRNVSFYLLAFGIVWLPSLVTRLQVFVLGKQKAPTFALAVLEAACMPLQARARAAALPARLAALHAH